mmetsp:Transcript_28591/g.72305  ORF Transcript_28591/g.72305 Transcript_28591/m.72305 type:complete len:127 (+) Transcript_28591:387-767(+)
MWSWQLLLSTIQRLLLPLRAIPCDIERPELKKNGHDAIVQTDPFDHRIAAEEGFTATADFKCEGYFTGKEGYTTKADFKDAAPSSCCSESVDGRGDILPFSVSLLHHVLYKDTPCEQFCDQSDWDA